MKGIVSKIATSSLVIALAMAGGVSSSVAQRRGFEVRQATDEASRQAATFSEQAARALRDGRLDEAREAMEQAVALSPRDAGYRLLLADIYLKGGRFASARATYADVLELDSSQSRAALGYALAQIALGNARAAVNQLDAYVDRAPPADIGLAYALAGETRRAIAILEPAARGFGATPRLRQNLALAYALAGDWRRARAVAAQDVSPADLPARMEQWAAFARPDAGPTRVAGLLGVRPVADPGQPVRLALNRPDEVRIAAAAPAPEAAPVALAAAAPQAPLPAPARNRSGPQPVPAQSAREVRLARAAQSLTAPAPRSLRAAREVRPTAPIFPRANPAAGADGGAYVVQIGAFSSEANAEAGWLTLSSRYGLRGRAPVTTTIAVGGRTLHRVAVAGFAGEADARRLCASVRAEGGACFVRQRAGDASIRWAARYAPNAIRRDV
jgi:Flp pilus assembly protein TadD